MRPQAAQHRGHEGLLLDPAAGVLAQQLHRLLRLVQPVGVHAGQHQGAAPRHGAEPAPHRQQSSLPPLLHLLLHVVDDEPVLPGDDHHLPDVTLPHLHRAAAATPRPAAPAAAQTFCPTVSARVLFCRPLAPYPSILTPHPSHLTPTQLSGRGRSGGDVHPRQSGRICKLWDGRTNRRQLTRHRDC